MIILLIIFFLINIVAIISAARYRKDWKESKRKCDYEEEIRNFKN
jgi:heme/copper-type cytochrome/quinol oxidase subunit 2